MVDGSETATQLDHRARNRRQNDPPGRARQSNPPGLHSVCCTRCDPLHGITVLCRHSDPARTAAAMSRPAAIKAVTSPLARLRCCDQNCAVESSGTGGLTDKVRQGRHAAEASRPANCAADQAPADPTETVAVPDRPRPGSTRRVRSRSAPGQRQHAVERSHHLLPLQDTKP